MTTVKAAPDLRGLFRRILEGASNVLPREATPEESERWRQAHAPKPEDNTAAEIAQHQADMRRKLAAVDEEFNASVNLLAERFAKGEVSGREFRGLFLTELRFALYSGAAIGAGGVGNLTSADVARVDAETRRQVAFVDRWIAQVEREPNREQSVGKLQQRARMYGGAAHTMAEATFDKNVMRDFPDFPDALRPKHNTQCHANCKCSIEWLNVDRAHGNADVYYRLHPAEHCVTCLLRSMAFSPLMIRDWQFVNMPGDLAVLMYNGTPQHFAPNNQRLVR